MIKSTFNCMKILRHCYCSGKWFVPKELLSTSISSGIQKNNRGIAIEKLLKKNFPKAENIEVTDLSGNCGSMFEVVVVSEEFDGLPLVKQHMLVTKALSEDIKHMHGIRIETKVPRRNNKSPPLE